MTSGDSDPGSSAERLCSELRRLGHTLSVAESCTGGYLGYEITKVPGASEVFWGGVMVYANAAKTELLDVPDVVIREHGAVSEQVAILLAEGMRRRADTDWSISITGIAGPGGALPDKPVGSVWIAVCGKAGTATQLFSLTGSRETIRMAAVVGAIDLLLAALAP